MKKSFKRLLSCIFVITFFLIGMCLDRARVNIPEVDSFSVSEAKVFATPEPSVSDTMPCTTEMLGLVRTSITNLTADRSSSRNVLRIFQFLLCGLCAAIGISIYFKSTGVMHDPITCSTTVTLNYIHQTDGKNNRLSLNQNIFW